MVGTLNESGGGGDLVLVDVGRTVDWVITDRFNQAIAEIGEDVSDAVRELVLDNVRLNLTALTNRVHDWPEGFNAEHNFCEYVASLNDRVKFLVELYSDNNNNVVDPYAAQRSSKI